jgi:hypothetical protein
MGGGKAASGVLDLIQEIWRILEFLFPPLLILTKENSRFAISAGFNYGNMKGKHFWLRKVK